MYHYLYENIGIEQLNEQLSASCSSQEGNKPEQFI